MQARTTQSCVARSLAVEGVSSRLFGLLVLASALLFNIYIAKPHYDWDLTAYVAAVYSFSERERESIHRKTYDELRANLPEAAYREITGDDDLVRTKRHRPYRKAIAENPEYLVQQLPFYTVKPAYVGLMLLMSETGMSPVTASFLIAKIAYAGIGLLLWCWLSASFASVPAALFTWVIISVPQLTDVARLPQPDALSTLLLLVCFYLLIERRRITAALTFLVFATLVRPDNLLLLVLLGSYVAVFHPEHRSAAITSGFLGMAIYFVVAKATGAYGWSTLFYHTHKEWLPAPAGFVSPLSVGNYARVYLSRAQSPELKNILQFIAPLNVLALLICYARGGVKDSWLHMLIVNGVYMAAHWLLFPSQVERFFVASYLLIFVSLANAVAPLFNGLGIPDVQAPRSGSASQASFSRESPV